MSESRLLKEFTGKDLSRLRNLLSGKAGDSTVSQIGYMSKEGVYKEGDVWEENGKKWTIKSGIKQTVTHLDNIKKMFNIPMLCPVCSSRMKDRLDRKMYELHGKCFSCVQSFETKLKLEGKYQEYAMSVMTANAETFIQEAKEYVEDFKKQTHNYYTESGQKEDWAGGAEFVERVTTKMEGEIEDLKNTVNTIKQIVNE